MKGMDENMDTTEKLQKINWLYLLLNIVGPVVFMIGMTALGLAFPQQIGVFFSIIGFGGAMLWWCFLGHKFYEKSRDAQIAKLEESGFVCNHTFNADGCTLIVDLVNGQVALIFRWNPGKAYVRPASALSNVYVDDGRGGAGFMEGSSRVSFLFLVDGMKIRVNTFSSNKRWRMDSDYILTGISKADVMVEALTAAGAKRR